MKINDLIKEYRFTLEQQEDLILRLDKYFIWHLNKFTVVDNDYIEKDNGVRFSFKTVFTRIHSLRGLERTCEEFVERIVKEINTFDEIYIKRFWKLEYIHPSHLDPYTYDYIENPTSGYWVLNSVIRGLNKEYTI